MTDEKRVVRVGIATIRALLQAKLQGAAVPAEGIGKRRCEEMAGPRREAMPMRSPR